MRNYNTMLHMKLNSAVSVFAVAAAFSVLLPPSNAYGGICFLPDCMDSDLVQGDFNMNLNEDTEYCEKEGYTYYASGECPQYYAKIGTCSRDDHYLKCDAVTWCKNNGYNTTSCSLPSFVDGQCPNGQPYYKQCKEDRPRACREQGYVNSCSPGRLYATSNRCPWDSSYGKCCTASPSSGCPSNYGVDCTGSASGTDACGYTCYKCCDDNCPSGTSKNYSGSVSTYTECGTACKRCKDCTSGSTSYSGSYVGSSECGSCYACSDTCRTGSKSVSCSSTEDKVRVSSTECGSSCYECQYNSDCSVSSKSCSYGCASYNSCGKCTSCDSCSNSCSRGSTSSYCSSGYTAKAVGSTQCGNTCYTCEKDEVVCTDTCSSKGYSSSKPSGQTCSTTTVCGKTCYYNCKSSCTDTCLSKGYSSSKPSGQTCSTTTVCGKTCYYNCKSSCTDTCSSKGYQSSQPSGQTCSTTTVCGKTCYYNCKTAEDARCEAARNGDPQYMPHYGYYMSCPYSGSQFHAGQEGIRLCCALYTGKNQNWGTFGSFSCDDEIYHICQ